MKRILPKCSQLPVGPGIPVAVGSLTGRPMQHIVAPVGATIIIAPPVVSSTQTANATKNKIVMVTSSDSAPTTTLPGAVLYCSAGLPHKMSPSVQTLFLPTAIAKLITGCTPILPKPSYPVPRTSNTNSRSKKKISSMRSNGKYNDGASQTNIIKKKRGRPRKQPVQESTPQNLLKSLLPKDACTAENSNTNSIPATLPAHNLTQFSGDVRQPPPENQSGDLGGSTELAASNVNGDNVVTFVRQTAEDYTQPPELLEAPNPAPINISTAHRNVSTNLNFFSRSVDEGNLTSESNKHLSVIKDVIKVSTGIEDLSSLPPNKLIPSSVIKVTTGSCNASKSSYAFKESVATKTTIVSKFYAKRNATRRTVTVREQLHALHCGIEHDEPLDDSILLRLSADYTNPHSKLGSCNKKSIATRLGTRHAGIRVMLCQICGKLLRGRSSLRSHMLTHAHHRPHHCTSCTAAFSSLQSLRLHMRSHTGETPFTCRICPAMFKTSQNVRRHERIHTVQARTHACSTCSKAFTSTAALKSHSKIHMTETALCSECGKSYKTLSSLAVHKLSHKYPEKLHKCKLCNKSYYFKSLLTRHLEGHDGVQKYNCHICSAKFVWKSGLVSHLQSHFQKRYRCRLCHLSFRTDVRLRSHMKKHSNPRPHSCTLCLKKFSFNYLLVRHIKSAHDHKDFISIKTRKIPAPVHTPAMEDDVSNSVRVMSSERSVVRDVNVPEHQIEDNYHFVAPVESTSAMLECKPRTLVDNNDMSATASSLWGVTRQYEEANTGTGANSERDPPPSYASSPCSGSVTKIPYMGYERLPPSSGERATDYDSTNGLSHSTPVYSGVNTEGYHTSPSSSCFHPGQHPNLLTLTDPYLHSSPQSCLQSPQTSHFSPHQGHYGLHNVFDLTGSITDADCSQSAYHSPTMPSQSILRSYEHYQ